MEDAFDRAVKKQQGGGTATLDAFDRAVAREPLGHGEDEHISPADEQEMVAGLPKLRQLVRPDAIDAAGTGEAAPKDALSVPRGPTIVQPGASAMIRQLGLTRPPATPMKSPDAGPPIAPAAAPATPPAPAPDLEGVKPVDQTTPGAPRKPVAASAEDLEAPPKGSKLEALTKALKGEINPTEPAPEKPAKTLVGRVGQAAEAMAAHPVDTGIAIATAPLQAGWTLGKFARQQQERSQAVRPVGQDATGRLANGELAPGNLEPGEDVVSPRDAAFAAGQLLVPAMVGKAAPYLSSVFGKQTAAAIAAAVKEGRSPAQALIVGFGKKVALGAGGGAAIGAVYSKDDPEIGAIFGAALGGAHAAMSTDKITVDKGEGGADLSQHPDRLIGPRGGGPKPAPKVAPAMAAIPEDWKGWEDPANQPPPEVGARQFPVTANTLSDYAKQKGVTIEQAATALRQANYFVDDAIITKLGGDPTQAVGPRVQRPADGRVGIELPVESIDETLAKHRAEVAAEAEKNHLPNWDERTMGPKPTIAEHEAFKAQAVETLMQHLPKRPAAPPEEAAPAPKAPPAADIQTHEINQIADAHDLHDLAEQVATDRSITPDEARRTIVDRMRQLNAAGTPLPDARQQVEKEFSPPAVDKSKAKATVQNGQEQGEQPGSVPARSGAPEEREPASVRKAAVQSGGKPKEAGAKEPASEAPARAAEPTELAKRPAVAGVEGSAGETFLSSGQKLTTKYRVIEADDLQPSHNPESFAANPNYPAGVQGREYAGKRGEAARSQVMTGALRPEVVLDRGSGTTDGPPVITHHGIVVAGNDRSMRIARAAKMSPEQYDTYRKELEKRAGDFGIDTKELAGMNRPVLVRQIDDKSVDVNDAKALGELNRASDTAPTKTKDQVTAAMSRAVAMRGANAALAHLTSTMDPETTVRDYLGSNHGRDFVRELVKDGVIASQELPAFVDKATNTVHGEGKQKIEDMLYAAAIGDADVMSRAPASVLKKIGPSVPAIVTANQVEEFSLERVLQGALDIHAGAAAMRSEAGSGARSIEDFLGQGDMFDRSHDPDAVALARYLETHKASDVTKALRAYASAASHAQRESSSHDIFGYQPESAESVRSRLFTSGERVAEKSPAYAAKKGNLAQKEDERSFAVVQNGRVLAKFATKVEAVFWRDHNAGDAGIRQQIDLAGASEIPAVLPNASGFVSEQPAHYDPAQAELFESRSPEEKEKGAALEAKAAFGSLAQRDKMAAEVERLMKAGLPTIGERVSQVDQAQRTWGTVDLVGMKVSTLEALARAMSVFRHPGMEIVHFLMLNEKYEVIAHHAETAGALNWSHVTTGEPIERAAAYAKKIGAKYSITVHNHPSGDPTPSRPDDYGATVQAGSAFQDAGVVMLGHLVINHNHVAWLGPEGSLPPAKALQKFLPAGRFAAWNDGYVGYGVGARLFEVTGMAKQPWDSSDNRPQLNSADAAARYAIAATSPELALTVVHVDVQRRVVAVSPKPAEAATMLHEWLPDEMKAAGSAEVFLIAPPELVKKWAKSGVSSKVKDILQVEQQPNGQAPKITRADILRVDFPTEERGRGFTESRPLLQRPAARTTDRPDGGSAATVSGRQLERPAGQVGEKDLFGYEAPAKQLERPKSQQASLFGELADAEDRARGKIALLRKDLEAAPAEERPKIAAKIAELEKLVNRDKAISAEEMATRAAAADGRLFEKGPEYGAEQHVDRFYSRLERAIHAAPFEKGTAEQWKAQLSKNVAAGEREWTGIDRLLAENTDKVLTKAQVAKQFEEKRITITESVAGAPTINRGSKYALPEVLKAIDSAGGFPNEMRIVLESDGNAYRALTSKFPALGDDEDWADKVISDVYGGVDTKDTKFDQYTEPGGDNYREIKIQLGKARYDRALQSLNDYTSRINNAHYDEFKAAGRSDRRGIRDFWTPAEEAEADRLYAAHTEAVARRRTDFHSNHFDEPNILVHARTTDRTLPNGEKALFIEELQSDWHQKGRESGYVPTEAYERVAALEKKEASLLKEDMKLRKSLMAPGTMTETFGSTPKRIQDIHDEVNVVHGEWLKLVAAQEKGVPEGPLKKTEEWMGLGMKRLIDEAVRGGYDRIAWTTGDQQADRYDLSQHVDRVTYDPISGQLSAWQGRDLVHSDKYDSRALPDVIGKDAAQKLLQSPLVPKHEILSAITGDYYSAEEVAKGYWDATGYGPQHMISGDDLKVGGAGMRTFYDQMLPKWVKEYGKKMGVKLDIEPVQATTKARSRTLTAEDVELLSETEENEKAGKLLADVAEAMRDSVADGFINTSALAALDFINDNAGDGQSGYNYSPREIGKVRRILAEAEDNNNKEAVDEESGESFARNLSFKVAPLAEKVKREGQFLMEKGPEYSVSEKQTQVKSAIGNRGSFDPKSRNILRENGPEYQGSHGPPGPEEGAPLNDLTGGGRVYPDDVYGPNAVQYYGTGEPAFDHRSLAIAHSVRGRPDASVTIYRAIPDDVTRADKIAKIEREKAYILRYGKTPPNVEPRIAGQPQVSRRYNQIDDELEQLKAQPEASEVTPSIQPGDWVTTNRAYAKSHGESALRGNYRILSKKVRASEVFTNGDSIHEWGYWPKGSSDANILREKGPEYSTGDDDEATGIKNAMSEKTRQALGLDERVRPEPRTQDEMYEAGKALADRDPGAMDRLIRELATDPEKIVGTKEEAGLLLKHRVDLDNQLKALIAAKDEAIAKKDEPAEALARLQLAAHRAEIKSFIELIERTGTAVGRALAARRMMSHLDYSLSNMEGMAEAAKGSSLTQQELERITGLYDELQIKLKAVEQDVADASERAANAEADLHHAQLKLEAQRPLIERLTAKLDTAAEAAIARIKARGLRAMAGMDPEDLADHAIVGAAELAHGAVHFADWSEAMVRKLGASIRPHLEEIFAAANKGLDKEVRGARATAPKTKKPAAPKDIRKKMKARIEDGIDDLGDLQAYLRQLALEHIREGITAREPLLDALHNDVKGIGLNVGRAEVRDALSGYGDFRPLSKEADKVRLREIQAESQRLAQLEALQKGKAPLATGFERQPPSDEARRLTQQVNAAKKAAGIGEMDREGRLKSALSAAKTRTRNAIKDLQTEIDTGERIVSGRSVLIPDAELEALQKQLADLRKTEAQVFQKPELTDAQRLALATRAAKRNADAWADRLEKARQGIFTTSQPKRQLGPSPELEAIRARSKAAQAEFAELHALDPQYQEEKTTAANRAYRTRLAQREAELLDRMARSDYSAKPVKPGTRLDAESLQRKADVERVKQEYQEMLHQYEKANRTGLEKARDRWTAWVRIGALSWPTVLEKLTSVALSRAITTPMTDLVALGVARALPRLAKGSGRYGTTSIAAAIHAEAAGLTAMWTEGIKSAGRMLANKRSHLDSVHGKHRLPPEIWEYLGQLHGALKEPVKQAEYARSLYRRGYEANLARENTTDPMVQMRLSNEAFLDAQRAVSMQDNALVKVYNQVLGSLEAKQKDTGKPHLGLQLLATALKTTMPIVKAPSNVVAEASNIISGALTGPARAAWAYHKGIEDLKPVERDSIIRLIAGGFIGLAMMLIGYYKRKDVGGFYTPGKRDPNDVPWGGMRVRGHTIPAVLLHNPFMWAASFGATVGRVADSRFHVKDPDPQGLANGMVAASLGLAKEMPFAREMFDAAKVAENQQSLRAGANAQAANVLVPGVVQWIAKQQDDSTRRKPVGFVQQLESRLPVITDATHTPISFSRKNVPEDTVREKHDFSAELTKAVKAGTVDLDSLRSLVDDKKISPSQYSKLKALSPLIPHRIRMLQRP